MGDSQQNRKDALEYLETQMRIAEIIDRQTKSFSTYNDALKEVKKNALALKKVNAEIADIQAQQKKNGKKLTDEQKARLEDLKQQAVYLSEMNKQLVSLKAVFKTIGNQLKTQAKNLLPDILGMYTKVDGSSRKTAINIGMSVNRMMEFRDIALQSSQYLEGLGISGEKAAEMMSAYANETGRQTMLSKEAIESMALLSKVTGVGSEEIATMAGQMQNFGMGAEQSVKMIEDIADISDKMGVNTQKVLKKVGSNLKLVNKLNFKEGVLGMAKMAVYTEKYKVQMEDVAGLAEKVFRPEGAIDAAANLQVLGGGLAKLGDPFTLMYKARNAPEELAESIVKSTQAVAQFDKKSGTFKVSAMDMDRFKEASEATGISMESMVEISKQLGRQDMLSDMLKGKVSKENMKFLSTISDIGDGGKLTVDGKVVDDLSKINDDYVTKLMKDKESREELAEQSMSTQEKLTNIMNSVLASFNTVLGDFDVNAVRPLIDKFVVPFAEGVKGIVKALVESGFVKTIAKFVANNPLAPLAGIALFKIAKWYLAGIRFGIGFNTVTSGKGGFLSRIGAMFGGRKGGDVVSGVTQGGQSMNAAQTLAGGRAAQLAGRGAMMSSLGSAAQILAVGAALMMLAKSVDILADAMVKIKEANVGLEQFAIVGLSMIIMMGMMIPLIGALGAVSTPVAVPLLALGAAFLMIGGAIWLATQGFAAMFEAIGPNGDSIMKAGLGMLGLAAGVYVLTTSLIALGAVAPLAGLGLAVLWGATKLLVGTAEKLEKTNIGTLVKDINAIDKEKLSMLKSLLYLSKEAKPIVVKFEDLKLDGDIKINGGGETVTMMMQEPYLSKLKDKIWDAMEKGKGGGKL
jgi:hypothetical protein